jgi:predicted RNase H-like HicB family nuclease
MAATRVLRCFAHEVRPNEWHAHCVTLCLDATGATYQEARTRLTALITDYLELVKEEGLTRELVPRHSPLPIRANYWGIWLSDSLRRLTDHFGDHEKQTLTFNCLANSMANA